MIWHDPKISLPDLDGRLTSARPIVFIVSGQPYVGHYHMNGCFYADRPHFMTRPTNGSPDYPVCEKWCYLDDLVRAARHDRDEM